MTTQEAKDSIAINQGHQNWDALVFAVVEDDDYEIEVFNSHIDAAMELFAERFADSETQRLKKDLEYAEDKNDDLKDEIRQLEREIEKLEEELNP